MNNLIIAGKILNFLKHKDLVCLLVETQLDPENKKSYFKVPIVSSSDKISNIAKDSYIISICEAHQEFIEIKDIQTIDKECNINYILTCGNLNENSMNELSVKLPDAFPKDLMKNNLSFHGHVEVIRGKPVLVPEYVFSTDELNI